MTTFKDYTVVLHPPQDSNQLWGAWCEELSLMASGETENEAFYNLVENIPVFFKIKNEKDRQKLLRAKKTSSGRKKTFKIPAFG